MSVPGWMYDAGVMAAPYGIFPDTSCQELSVRWRGMRADRLLRMVLLLQARGRMTGAALAEELEVSVRTIYRDLEALSAAGIPVYAEPGPGGGCRLIEGYRSSLAGLTKDEAAALLTLGVPAVLNDLGIGPTMRSAHERVRAVAGIPNEDRRGAPRHAPLVPPA